MNDDVLTYSMTTDIIFILYIVFSSSPCYVTCSSLMMTKHLFTCRWHCFCYTSAISRPSLWQGIRVTREVRWDSVSPLVPPFCLLWKRQCVQKSYWGRYNQQQWKYPVSVRKDMWFSSLYIAHIHIYIMHLFFTTVLSHFIVFVKEVNTCNLI